MVDCLSFYLPPSLSNHFAHVAGEPTLISNQVWTFELPAVSSTTPSCNGSESTLADCVAVPLDQSTDCDNVAVEVTCSRPISAAAPTSIAPLTSDSIPDSVDTETQVPMSSTPPHSTETEGSVNKTSALPSSQASSSPIGFHTSLPKPGTGIARYAKPLLYMFTSKYL